MRWGWIRSMFEASSTTQFPAGGGLLVRWSAGVTLDAISSLKPLVKVEALVLIKPLSPPTCGIWCALLTVRNNQAEIQYLTSEKDGEQDVWGRGRGSSPTMGSIERNVWARSYIIAAGGKMKKKNKNKETDTSQKYQCIGSVCASFQRMLEWMVWIVFCDHRRPSEALWWNLMRPSTSHTQACWIHKEQNHNSCVLILVEWLGAVVWRVTGPLRQDAPASQQASKPAFILLNVQKKWAEWDHSAL